MYEGNEVEREIYHIPANYMVESTVLGGMLPLRRTIEGAILAGIMLAIFNGIGFMPSSVMGWFFALAIILLPGIIGLVGIRGEPLSNVAISFIEYRIAKRKMHFRRIKKSNDDYSFD